MSYIHIRSMKFGVLVDFHDIDHLSPGKHVLCVQTRREGETSEASIIHFCYMFRTLLCPIKKL